METETTIVIVAIAYGALSEVLGLLNIKPTGVAHAIWLMLGKALKR